MGVGRGPVSHERVALAYTGERSCNQRRPLCSSHCHEQLLQRDALANQPQHALHLTKLEFDTGKGLEENNFLKLKLLKVQENATFCDTDPQA